MALAEEMEKTRKADADSAGLQAREETRLDAIPTVSVTPMRQSNHYRLRAR